MIRWTIAIAVGLLAAWLAYGRGGAASRKHAWWLAALRALAVTAVAALLVGAPAGRATPLAPLVAVDVSSSLRRASGDDSTAIRAWRARMADSLSTWTNGDGPIVVVGDSVRDVTPGELKSWTPSDASSRVRSAVDRAASLGRPLVLVTDGEVDDAEAIAEAPAGSRVIASPASTKRDVAVADLTVPSSATGGDTISVATSIASGAVATPDGSLLVHIDGAQVASVAIPALAPYSTTRVTASVTVPRGTNVSIVQAIAQVASDVEPRNDTVSAAIEIGDRPSAVFVSTAPDLDVREALTVLRGSLDVPTRAYLRIAPNVWKVEGSYAAISESEVRARASAAGMLILHGDTSWLSSAAAGDSGVRARAAARALWAPAPPTVIARAGELTRTPEWYANAAPASPLMAALATLPFDSLPPITLAGPAVGAQTVLTAQLGKRGAPVPAVATREARGVRTAVVSGSGWAGWSLRGGRSRDAFTALWGALFDWLAAGRGDVRAARPVQGLLRAGDPLLWRRGGADTVVAVQVRRREPGAKTSPSDSGAAQTLTLRFADQEFETASPSMPAGVYDIESPGGNSVLVVNASREWLPRAPSISAGPATKGTSSSDAPRFGDKGWPFVLALLLLCAEWIARRLAGQR